MLSSFKGRGRGRVWLQWKAHRREQDRGRESAGQVGSRSHPQRTAELQFLS